MRKIKCTGCNQAFDIADAVLHGIDQHRYAFDTVGKACCPYCGHEVDAIGAGQVQLARLAKPRNLIILSGFALLSLIALATETIRLVGPLMVFTFGLYLAATARTRDHRAIGWLVVGLSLILALLAAGLILGD